MISIDGKIKIKVEKNLNKKIRFINANYKDLFYLEDGETIKIIYPDKMELEKSCKYLDDTHFNLDSTCFHIFQFAELMKKVHAVVKVNDVEYHY